jgi:hypothetical protein
MSTRSRKSLPANLGRPPGRAAAAAAADAALAQQLHDEEAKSAASGRLSKRSGAASAAAAAPASKAPKGAAGAAAGDPPFLAELARYDTATLRAWATAFDKCPALADSASRHEVIAAFRTMGEGALRDLAPKTALAHWRATAGSKGQPPSLGDEMDELNVPDARRAAYARGAVPPDELPATAPLRLADAPAGAEEDDDAATRGTGVASSGRAQLDDQCPHCLEPAPPGGKPVFICSFCYMRSDLESSHATNQALIHIASQRADLRRAADERKLHSTAASASDSAPPKEKLTRLDTELARLAAAGPSLPRFALTGRPTSGGVTVAEALRIGNESYNAISYTEPSAQLLALIQSGRLVDVGYAVPRLVSSVDPAQERAEHLVAYSAGGAASVINTTKPPELQSLAQFCDAFFSTIGPALIERPQALTDWFALTRTLLAINSSPLGWPGAREYLKLRIHRATLRSASFAEYDTQAMDAAKEKLGSGAASGRLQHANAAPSRAAGGGGGMFLDDSLQLCRSWNKGAACMKTPCPFNHHCSLRACTATNRGHRAIDCVHRPAGWDPSGGSGRSGGGRGGAARGGGRGGGRGGRTDGAKPGGAPGGPAAAATPTA